MRAARIIIVFVSAILLVVAAPLVYGEDIASRSEVDPAPAQPNATDVTSPGSDTRATPVAGQKCPQWVHDQYVTIAPDGKTYPTWHPPVDPQYGCYFGHEHGADPRTSRANADMPAFGYAAAQMDMVEPHVGYKVFVMNAGAEVESNVSNKIATDDVRLVFHMGTSGVARYSQEMHSIQLDVVDESGTGAFAHVTGVSDTGPTDQDGSTCDTPRKGAKDFSTVGCADTYEIWNFVRFQILDPHDPFNGVDQSRFGATPSVAVFDPITTRDPSDLTQLLFTQDLKGNPSGVPAIDPRSPNAAYLGCRREFYAGPLYWNNPSGTTVYYTDALGRVSPSGQGDSSHRIRQEVGTFAGHSDALFKDRRDFCENGVQFPN